MKKKGITLIELVLVIAIAVLMVGVVDSLFRSYLKNYKNNIMQNRGFNYLREALVIIDKEVNLNANKVTTEENIIKIEYSDETTVNYIKSIHGNLYVLYGTKFSIPTNSSPKNMIIDEVEGFMAIRSGKALYIKIIWCNGQSIERCLPIENAN